VLENMINDPVQYLIDICKNPDFGLQNPFLELAARVVEIKQLGLDYSRLLPTWEKMRDERRASLGIFLRKPNDFSISTSHDELLGICVLSHIFDGGRTAKEIEEHGLTFGLWITGRNEHGKKIDSEWFSYWRPEYRAFVKLAQGKPLSYLERTALDVNLLVSRAWNVKRVRLLFLKNVLPDEKPNLLTRLVCFLTKHKIDANTGVQRQAEIAMGDKYKGRYGDDALLNYLWSLY
jgi:hypothetical protein